ncbi:type VI secretion system-associated protein TagF [Methylocella sp.]|uniref:type VI secretion system-associated protein TagF n=1 Tax=Methylocella sp. TaxID=1978226 RepID=UPI0037851FC7
MTRAAPLRMGLFGKIAARPDYVAHDAPRPFIAALEPWLHAGVAASRLALDRGWRSAFLAAPLWRFWLGGEICGAPALGVMAPSIDMNGRYFPLLAFAMAEGAEGIAPPELVDQEAFLKAAEELLLGTLAPGAPFEAALAALAALPRPKLAPLVAARAPALALRGGLMAPLDDTPPERLFASLRRADWARTYGAASFWHTRGGADFRPLAMALSGLPDPSLFTLFLTGKSAGGAGAGM